MIVSCLIGLWTVMIAAPGTPIARTLCAWLVERPAAWSPRIGRGHVIVAVVIAGILAAAVWLLDSEGLHLLAMAAPDAAIWLTTFEVATFVDAFVAVTTIATATRWRWLLGTVRPMRRASRRRRSARKDVPPPANDDDPPVYLAATRRA